MTRTLRRLLFLPLLLPVILFAQTANEKGQWLAPACKPKLFGLQDAQGNPVLAPTYDFLSEAEGDAWIAMSAGKYGVINGKGEWLIRPQFFGIEQYRLGKAVAAKKVQRPKTYNSYSYDLDYYRSDSVIRYGIVDESGVWVIDASYDYLEIGDDGTVLYTDENGYYGFLNPDGSVLVRAQFVYATPMSGGAAVIGERNSASEVTEMYTYGGSRDAFRAGNYFVIDRNGKKTHEQPYDLIRAFSEGRAAFNKGGLWKRNNRYDEQKMIGGKWGFLDANGNAVVGATYDYVYDFENGKAKVRLGERTFWIDKDGKETTPPAVETTTRPQVFCEPGSFGYIDLKGNWVIQPQYYAAHEFSEGLAAVMTLRASDMDCSEPEFSNGDRNDPGYNNSLFRVGTRRRRGADEMEESDRPRRRLFGYIDAGGNMVIPAKYEVALPFHENRAYVCFRGKWGVIDRQGNWIMAPVLDWLSQMSYNSAYYTHSRYNFGYQYVADLDGSGRYEKGREFDSPPQTDLYLFKEGMGAIYYKGKFGFIDTTGKIVVAPVYDYVGAFSQGLAAVRHNDRWGYIDKTGKEVIPLRFLYAGPFAANGLAVVGTTLFQNDLPHPEDGMEYDQGGETFYGYIDRSGKYAIKPQFSSASDFSEGLAVVAIDYGSKGFIDEAGKFVLPAKYDYADGFVNGFAYVHMRMYEGVYIDKKGKVSKLYTTKNPPSRTAAPLHAHYDAVGRYGFVNTKGEETIPHTFRFAGNFAWVGMPD